LFMSPTVPKVVVLICTYNGRHFLEECLQSVLNSDDPGIERQVVVVDNASTDGSATCVLQHFPAVEVVRAPANTGFAGGNNSGWQYIQRKHPDALYLVLLNHDTVVRSGWLTPLARFLDEHSDAGAA